MRNGRSRSSEVIDFVTNRKRVCDFLSVISMNLVLSVIVSKIRRFQGRKSQPFLDPLLITGLRLGYHLDFLDESYAESLRCRAIHQWRLRNRSLRRFDTILARVGQTDRQTDMSTMAITALSIVMSCCCPTKRTKTRFFYLNPL